MPLMKTKIETETEIYGTLVVATIIFRDGGKTERKQIATLVNEMAATVPGTMRKFNEFLEWYKSELIASLSNEDSKNRHI